MYYPLIAREMPGYLSTYLGMYLGTESCTVGRLPLERNQGQGRHMRLVIV